MALPAGVETVTVSTAEPLTLPDGTPIRGRLIFRGPELATVAEDDLVFGGETSVDLVDGMMSVELVATDATGVEPSGWTYQVDARLHNAPDWTRYISLPKATPEVDLADILVPDPVAGTFSTLVPEAAITEAVEDHSEADDPHGDRAYTGQAIAAHSADIDPHGDRAYADTAAAVWRRRTLPDLATADMAYAGTAPVVSTTQSTTPTISDAVTYAPHTAPILYLGAADFQYGTVFPDTNYYLPTSRYPHTYSSGQTNWSLEFWTDAAEFEVGFKHISAATMYRLSIDRCPVTDLMQSAGGITPGSSHMLKIDLGSAEPRLIRLDLTTFPFRGIYLPPTATMWRPTARGGRLAVLGDSLTDGSAQNVGFGSGTWLARTARLLGCTDAWNQSRGGTGYITAGSFAPFGDRVADDIVAYAPDRVIVWGGYNDSTGSQDAIAAAAADVYAALTAGLPDADIVVIGCWSPTGSPAASLTDTDTTLRTQAAAAKLPFISPITGGVYGADGQLVDTQGPWITAQNAGTYVGADGTHPTDAGHIYLSRRIYTALAALMGA